MTPERHKVKLVMLSFLWPHVPHSSNPNQMPPISKVFSNTQVKVDVSSDLNQHFTCTIHLVLSAFCFITLILISPVIILLTFESSFYNFFSFWYPSIWPAKHLKHSTYYDTNICHISSICTFYVYILHRKRITSFKTKIISCILSQAKNLLIHTLQIIRLLFFNKSYSC